jgi:hypothetical protein
MGTNQKIKNPHIYDHAFNDILIPFIQFYGAHIMLIQHPPVIWNKGFKKFIKSNWRSISGLKNPELSKRLKFAKIELTRFCAIIARQYSLSSEGVFSFIDPRLAKEVLEPYKLSSEVLYPYGIEKLSNGGW